jgi:hypothetical protein
MKKKVRASRSRHAKKRRAAAVILIRGTSTVTNVVAMVTAIVLGVVIIGVYLAIGTYVPDMLRKTGVGNATVYGQVQSQLSNVSSQWGNALNILMLTVIIIALGVIIKELRGWGGLAGGA